MQRLETKVKMIRKWIDNGYQVTPEGKLLHRVIYEQAVGKIPFKWVVHHVDFNKSNNNIENLIAMPSHLHDQIHRVMAKTRVKLTKKQIEQTVAAYVNLDKNRNLKIQITIPVHWCQVEEVPSVQAKIITSNKKSGSALYR